MKDSQARWAERHCPPAAFWSGKSCNQPFVTDSLMIPLYPMSMKLTLSICAVSILLCSSLPDCFSQTTISPINEQSDGNSLLSHCQYVERQPEEMSGNQMTLGIICMTYVAGVSAGFEHGIGKAGVKKAMCMPEGVHIVQEVRVINAYLREHPEELHKSASMLVLRSLDKAFPCKSSP
jgi:hypothetical protein